MSYLQITSIRALVYLMCSFEVGIRATGSLRTNRTGVSESVAQVGCTFVFVTGYTPVLAYQLFVYPCIINAKLL